jgi:hypothetical protein
MIVTHLGKEPHDGTGWILSEQGHDGVLNHRDLPMILRAQHLKEIISDTGIDILHKKYLGTRISALISLQKRTCFSE